MKNILIPIIVALIAGIAGYWIGMPNDEKKILELRQPKDRKIKLLTAPIPDEPTARKFVRTFKDSLAYYHGIVKWPRDSLSGQYVDSWTVDLKYIILMKEELSKLKNVSDIAIRLYPVFNDKKVFSLMLVGEYRLNGKKYILKRLVDTTTGSPGPEGTDIAPMYEWLDPCPPFDCPDNDF